MCERLLTFFDARPTAQQMPDTNFTICVFPGLFAHKACTAVPPQVQEPSIACFPACKVLQFALWPARPFGFVHKDLHASSGRL